VLLQTSMPAHESHDEMGSSHVATDVKLAVRGAMHESTCYLVPIYRSH
jgi:hypothetical protein